MQTPSYTLHITADFARRQFEPGLLPRELLPASPASIVLRLFILLVDCPEYKVIANFDAEISRCLESECLPFEKGVHLCPIPPLGEVDRKPKEFAGERPCPCGGAAAHPYRAGAHCRTGAP